MIFVVFQVESESSYLKKENKILQSKLYGRSQQFINKVSENPLLLQMTVIL